MNNRFRIIEGIVIGLSSSPYQRILRPTIDVECTVIETKPLNLYMQPSEIHKRQELKTCIDAVKTLKGEDKQRCKQRIKELESELGIHLERASIATDEHEEV